MDYIPYIPEEPPQDIVEFVLGKNIFPEYLIFKCSDSRKKTAICHCSACGNSFEADWGKADGCHHSVSYFTFEGMSYKSHDKFKCPFCDETVYVRHVGDFYGDNIYNTAKVQTISRHEKNIIVSSWYVEQKTFKNGSQKFEVKPYEHFVFEKRKAVTVRCYGAFFSNKYPTRPHQLKKFTPPDYVPDLIYPWEKDILKGSYMENSRLDVYLEKSRLKNPVQHLRCYQDFNRLDVLLDCPLCEMIVEEEDRKVNYYTSYSSPTGKFKKLNRKEKSPFKILGIDRAEMQEILKADIGYQKFCILKSFKEKGGKLTAENIKMLCGQLGYVADEILKEEKPTDIFRYLNKDTGRTWHMLQDYWRMAALLGFDLDNPVIKFPKDLGAKHNDVMAKVKWQKDKLQAETFKKLAESFEAVRYTNGRYCIRIAQSEEELIFEAKSLKHCVGGYGKSHCEGRSIFFVRRADRPDEPLYTLQMNLKSGLQIQLHGYNNELDGQVIPQEVHDFIDFWKNNIFRRFDVNKMKFIDKPKAAATA